MATFSPDTSAYYEELLRQQWANISQAGSIGSAPSAFYSWSSGSSVGVTPAVGSVSGYTLNPLGNKPEKTREATPDSLYNGVNGLLHLIKSLRSGA